VLVLRYDYRRLPPPEILKTVESVSSKYYYCWLINIGWLKMIAQPILLILVWAAITSFAAALTTRRLQRPLIGGPPWLRLHQALVSHRPEELTP
jgi:hypothetical protein